MSEFSNHMNNTPPFDPPYTTTHRSASGVNIIETRADGTTRSITSGIGCQPFGAKLAKVMPKTVSASTPTRGKIMDESLIHSNSKAAVILNVSFSEKDAVKKKGSRWDVVNRNWYVPHGLDINLFKKWWPDALK